VFSRPREEDHRPRQVKDPKPEKHRQPVVRSAAGCIWTHPAPPPPAFPFPPKQHHQTSGPDAFIRGGNVRLRIRPTIMASAARLVVATTSCPAQRRLRVIQNRRIGSPPHSKYATPGRIIFQLAGALRLGGRVISAAEVLRSHTETAGAREWPRRRACEPS